MIRIVMIDIALLLPCRALDGEGPYPLAAVTNQAELGAIRWSMSHAALAPIPGLDLSLLLSRESRRAVAGGADLDLFGERAEG